MHVHKLTLCTFTSTEDQYPRWIVWYHEKIYYCIGASYTDTKSSYLFSEVKQFILCKLTDNTKHSNAVLRGFILPLMEVNPFIDYKLFYYVISKQSCLYFEMFQLCFKSMT